MGNHGSNESSSPSLSIRRPVCTKCSKPIKLCLCSRFTSPPLDNSISITVLQHTHEVKHPLNSTCIAKLGFKNISVIPISDVNLHALLEILPLNAEVSGSGSEPVKLGSSTVNGDGSSNYHANLDEKLEKSSLLLSTSGDKKERLVLDNSRANPKPGKSVNCCNADGNDNTNCIVKEMNKYKVMCSPTSLTVTLERLAKHNLNWVPKTPVGKSLIENGFRVKKLHTKKKGNSTEIYEIVEYDMVVPPNSALLFLNEKSVSLDSVDFEVKNLIVLDGTWGKAQRMYHENPWLKLLPHIKLNSKQESLYSEVRHEPKSGCLSTIESVIFALKKLGEDADSLDMILGVFESMILDQRRYKDENFCVSSQT